MLCGDFNVRTGNLNALSHDSNEDTITFVQTELCEYRQSEDKTVNAFGRLLLTMCAGDEKGHFTYVCAAGCSIVDYYICSQEFTEHNMKLHVAEKFDINTYHWNFCCSLRNTSPLAKTGPFWRNWCGTVTKR